ncbi:MAG: HAD-IA family hydrolase [Candidatus Sumerlaeaceae bacterium]|nr:HAD-IA family hydrolase [Candidatus Sumerlaeaceae bacterium]
MSDNFDIVLFDAGGTLLGTNTDHEHWYEQFFVDACAEQGTTVTSQAVSEALKAAGETAPLAPRCSTPEQVRDFWFHIYSGAFERLLSGCDSQDLANHYIDRFESGEFLELFADALPTLDALAAQGIRAGVVSNFGVYLRDFLDITGITQYFDFVLISASEGCEKPDPEIFRRALGKAACPPERILFVGDHPVEDYQASGRHEMRPLLIDRHNRHSKLQDVHRISHLTELLSLL